MMPNQTVAFIKALQRRCTEMGWNSGTKNITSFQNKDNVTIDIIKQYGQIDESTLRTACERFCSAAGADFRTRAKQNNTMMSICLAKSLMAEAQARLLPYQKDYLIRDVECALLMYKVIMRLATIDSVATNQALCDNLQALGAFAGTVSGDIDKINTEFDKNYSQLIARGKSFDNPIGALFTAYQVVPCFHFKTYINRMHKDYLNSKLPTMTHGFLMGMAKSKFNYLRNKGMWGAKSHDDDKIVAMTATINELKGQLKLSPQLAAATEKGNKKKKEKGWKNKNKKDKSDRVEHKKDEAWKRVPPKDGEKHKKKHDKHTYYWCKHHTAWTMHSPKECCLGKEQKGEKVSSATVAAAATTAVNPSYQALLCTLAKFQDKE
jgi:hypothetical protein